MADEPIEAPSSFHHVTLSVDHVSNMELIRGNQKITALVSVKMNNVNAYKLLKLLEEQLSQHKAGYITFTLEGRFT